MKSVFYDLETLAASSRLVLINARHVMTTTFESKQAMAAKGKTENYYTTYYQCKSQYTTVNHDVQNLRGIFLRAVLPITVKMSA